ncbi:helix-turn-helix transcriptional regulator [Rhodopseudomonas sp. BR0M22]|uniref:helix-turn-helix transcriptional regulator n=1 Tax=Rhodopseudomonas sp. BR0M22 TaxID=2269369 RepID=UPI0013E0663E|nr:helix-turn-helix transcriptional regulator [Rhodopseudomonas sp. BR0M22]MCD0416027.1 helix-turn-helix transcriptional regulator [Rubrivivax sp. JA1024]NEW92031.1 helix-turn-helix transcriptional regulator [Rhodopseudomonas sp. BR0M22]
MDLLQYIDGIYEAAVVPEKWPDVLGSLSQEVSGDGGVLFTFARKDMSWTTSSGIRDLFLEFLNDGWAAINPRPVRLSAGNHPGFVRDSDVFTAEELANDPVYAFYRRKGIGWAVGTMLDTPSGDSIVFSFERAYSKGPVPTEVVQAFDRIRPHLARGALLAARLGLEQARSMANTLLALGLPGGVLDRRGRLVASNALLDALVPSTMQDRRDRLMLSDPLADRLLEGALSYRGLPGAGSRSIPIAAAIGRPAMIVHLLPIHGVANDVFSVGRSLVVVTPVDRSAVPNAEVIQGLFDLTPAEARVARSIGEARSVEDIAAAQGISRETVRAQLKAVLAKTGLSRQQELVSLLAGRHLPWA